MTEPDPNETARIPTPGTSGEPPTEGWPGSTSAEPTAPGSAPSGDASLGTEASDDTFRAEPMSAEPTATEPAPAEPPPAWTPPPTPAPAATDWSPTASPPATRRRKEPDTGRAASVVFGLVMLAIGLWFFAEQTLGLDLPPIRWSQFWPVILIGLGVWIVLGSMRRGSR